MDTKTNGKVRTARSNPQPRAPVQSRYKKTNTTMAACLFIMDDTLRLMEWIAYHYTVLPLGIWLWPLTLILTRSIAPDEGWGRQVFGPRGGYRAWFLDKSGDTYRAQAHKRRQNFFFSSCLQGLYNRGIRSWTILIDSDEFLLFNYRHPSEENASRYDAVTKIISAQDLDRARNRIVPIRDQLPTWQEEVTVADFLQNYTSSLSNGANESKGEWSQQNKQKQEKVELIKEHAWETAGVLPRRPKCLRFPHLRFSSYESNPLLVKAGMPEHVDPTTLITLRQRKVGPMDPLFSKAMLDLSQAKSAEWFNFKGVVNVHTPSRRMCGRTTKVKFSGSGTDYISSLFRIHHYRSGTIETYLERSGDYRGSSIWRFYAERNIVPVNENDDIRGWIHWFIRKMGETKARELLLRPMEESYHSYQHHDGYAGAKEVLERLQGDDPLDHSHDKKEVIKYNYTRTTAQMAACLFIRDGNIRLIEWIAYHYTVLPLGSLVVGISSESKQAAALRETANRWSSRMKVTVWSDDEWGKDAHPLQGWKRNPREGGDKLADWYMNKTSDEYLHQAEVRRELMFQGKCLAQHRKQKDPKWTVVLHPSDFVVFNYKGPQENPVKFDSKEPDVRTKDDIIQARTETSPIRDRLPVLSEKVTIADFLHGEKLTKCVRMPGLEIGPREFGTDEGAPLLTMRQREFGVKKGTWVKVMVDASLPVHMKKIDSIHNLPMCGWNGRLEATDYISSLIRFHFFKIGSLETYVEKHSMDPDAVHTYKNVSDEFEPMGDDHGTLTPWVDWFVDKVGKADADELLFIPLTKAYTAIREGNKALSEAREDIDNGGGDER
ncbi:hypothetical protein MHU86_6056 [Fragilaria crotonensis]|nr:hypothetical protein MHU86_6056 [Fragilaria crotonensis]